MNNFVTDLKQLCWFFIFLRFMVHIFSKDRDIFFINRSFSNLIQNPLKFSLFLTKNGMKLNLTVFFKQFIPKRRFKTKFSFIQSRKLVKVSGKHNLDSTKAFLLTFAQMTSLIHIPLSVILFL